MYRIYSQYLHQFFNKIRHKLCPDWTGWELAIVFLVSLSIIYSSYNSIINLYHHFYYAWGEMLINYAGGPVRRGLFGALITPLAGNANFKLYVLSLYTLIVSLVYILFIRDMSKVFDKTLIIFLIGSPCIFSFMFFEAYFRKDIFIQAAFCSIMIFIYYAYKHKYDIKLILFIFSVIYIPAFLTTELTLFYMGVPLILILYSCDSKKDFIIFLLFSSIIVAASIFLVFYFKGSEHERNAIISFWSNYFPQINGHDSYALKALNYIGQGLSSRKSEEYLMPYLLTYRFRFDIIVALLLTSMPLTYIFRKYNIHHCLKSIYGLTKTIYLYTIILLSFFMICLVMNDVGRIISTFSIYMIFSIVTIIKIFKLKFPDSYNRAENIFTFNNPVFFIFSILYMFFWTIHLWVPLDAKTYFTLQPWLLNYIEIFY